MQTALIIAAILFGWIFGSWVARKIVCRIYGHRWDASMGLWRDCERCGKHQTLKIGVGYVD